MNRGFFLLVALCLLTLLHNHLSADVIAINDGRVVRGTIIQTNDYEVLVLSGHGTFKCLLSDIRKIKQESEAEPSTFLTNKATKEQRIPDWRRIVAKLAPQLWTGKLRQIPATVITNGILRNVPYISFRCGVDYEVNIYGDLDNPAGLEVGMYHGLASSEHARDNAINFITSILLKDADKAMITNLNRAQDLKTHESMTFEITPQTASDSYGGWWVSVYDEKALEKARVSDKELENISLKNSEVMSATNVSTIDISWSKEDLQYARPASGFTTQIPVGPPPVAYTPENADSDSADYGGRVSSSHNYNHGSVYVRGYTRKDGTYVHSYTRSR